MQKEYEFVEMRKVLSHGTSTCIIAGNKQELEIYECPRSHGVFAIDSSWLAQDEYRLVVSPFDPHIIFDFGREDDETSEEKKEIRDNWMEDNIPR